MDTREIKALTFDFFDTLAHHRNGRGRGAMLREYFQEQGLGFDPWEHQVLYDVFEHHLHEYSNAFSAAEHLQYITRMTERLFRRLNVGGSNADPATHAVEIWQRMGPKSLVVFPEVPGVLRQLREAGYRVAIVSNWQCGLVHFCTELGFTPLVDHVIASADVGCAKPDRAIFAEASRRLGTPPEHILHVGDTLLDDIEGATNAEFQSLLICRDPDRRPAVPTIRSLDQVRQALAGQLEFTRERSG